MSKKSVSTLLALFLFLLTSGRSPAEVELPQLFSNHMVLQRNRPVPVWGQAKADQRVTVSINGQTKSVTADASGRWRVDLPAMKAGGPHTLEVEGDDRIVVNDVLIGDVWICSGQSNMEWPLHNTREAKTMDAVSKAEHDRIRLFELPHMAADSPQNRLKKSVKWTACTPDTAKDFSAVGYFFGRRLYKVLSNDKETETVPIGLIQSAWGGSKAEAWTSRQTLKTHPQLRSLLSNMNKIEHERHTPTHLHNTMIRPLIPFAIQGTIWYQGESNIGKPYQYRTLFPSMIQDWRDRWGQGDFPFYFVQLAPYNYGDRGRLPLFWESQRFAHKTLPRTGMAVINDHGNPDDIHPRTKKPVGDRLARWALKQVYGKEVVPSGPLYERVSIQGNQAVIHFNHTGEGLQIRDGKSLSQFQIAGPDRTFYPAEARIDGDTVIVHSKKVQHPVAVRYAWKDDARAHLLNSEGLPASSFRTDGWSTKK